MHQRSVSLFCFTSNLGLNGLSGFWSSFRRDHTRGRGVVAETNLAIFKDTDVSREATWGVVRSKPPSSADTVAKVGQDHDVNRMGNNTFRVGPSRVFFVTQGNVNVAVESNTRIGLFTRGAEVASDLFHMSPTNVAIHHHGGSKRPVVFRETLSQTPWEQ